jgi:hypothetical protein
MTRAITCVGSFTSSFSALDAKATEYLATQFAAYDQVNLHLFERNALFMTP